MSGDDKDVSKTCRMSKADLGVPTGPVWQSPTEESAGRPLDFEQVQRERRAFQARMQALPCAVATVNAALDRCDKVVTIREMSDQFAGWLLGGDKPDRLAEAVPQVAAEVSRAEKRAQGIVDAFPSRECWVDELVGLCRADRSALGETMAARVEVRIERLKAAIEGELIRPPYESPLKHATDDELLSMAANVERERNLRSRMRAEPITGWPMGFDPGSSVEAGRPSDSQAEPGVSGPTGDGAADLDALDAALRKEETSEGDGQADPEPGRLNIGLEEFRLATISGGSLERVAEAALMEIARRNEEEGADLHACAPIRTLDLTKQTSSTEAMAVRHMTAGDLIELESQISAEKKRRHHERVAKAPERTVPRMP